MKRWARPNSLLLAGLLFAAAPVAMLAAQDWNITFAQTERGNSVGNPEAPAQLVEFVSYTCSHCAHFEEESDAVMRAHFLHQGLVEVEVRSYLRNPVDLAATLVAQCGDPAKFFGNHRALMLGQDTWLEKARNTTEAQQQRWSTGTMAARMRAIGDDLDFHELMAGRGYTVAEVNRCLSDETKAQEIIARHEANTADFAIPGTPSFAVNGRLLDGIHDWGSLQRVLSNPALAESTGSQGE